MTSQRTVPSDLEISKSATLAPITDVAETLGADESVFEPLGRYKGKLRARNLPEATRSTPGKLVLVTAISPTPAGEGKTATAIGLTDALSLLGRRAVVCLRQPSLGPAFGMKGGAAGGGYAQVVPMEDINLHFTGDFHAITAANNLLSAAIENHLYWGNTLGLDRNAMTWRRCLDSNDRGLRRTVVAPGEASLEHTTGFDITAASETMAIFSLARDLGDLRESLGRATAGYALDGRRILARELEAEGAMTALLCDAFDPNLVQTLHGTPAFVHGGPFANVAHGCSSVIATETALRLGEIVVTEAGFGADLGAQKFFDIKCRRTGLRPHVAVMVATARALKMHGGVAKTDLASPDVEAVRRGLPNLERHVKNVRRYGVPVVVALNRFATDSDAELDVIVGAADRLGVPSAIATHHADGAAGARVLAQRVAEACEGAAPELNLLYPDTLPLLEKLERTATIIYGAERVEVTPEARAQLDRFERDGYGHLPIVVAKTPYSFSADKALLGAPSGHVLPLREARLASGAGFVVAICGDTLTMPGLPRDPALRRVDVDGAGRIVGLS